MMRVVRGTTGALLLALSILFVTPVPASAAACDTGSSRTVTGGYVVTVHCTGVGFIDGYGSTLTDANLEALSLYQVYQNHGVPCDGSSTGRATGGYVVTLWCSGLGFSDAYGSNLTDAARAARELAELYGETGLPCDGSGTRTVTGGYEVTLWCSGLGFIDGRGSTLTGAARVARLSASL
jgi:hypothetical protein